MDNISGGTKIAELRSVWQRMAILSGLGLSVCQFTSAQEVGGGWTIEKKFLGDETDLNYGMATTLLGDIDQDQWLEILIGAPRAKNLLGEEVGRIALISGQHRDSLRVNWGQVKGAEFGTVVIRLNDLNHDSVPDYAVGAPGDDRQAETASGSVFVYSGATGGQLRQIRGTQANERLGTQIVALNDVDGDGRADFLIAGSGEAGAKLISAGNWRTVHKFPGRWDGMGEVDDLDGDGIEDLALTRKGNAVTRIYSSVTGNLLGQLPGGYSVIGIGDINQDGVGEILVGDDPATVYSDATGTVLKRIKNPHHHGRMSAQRDLGNGWEGGGLPGGETNQTGAQPKAVAFGKSVVRLSDLNADGVVEFAISNPQAPTEDGAKVGEVYIYSGMTMKKTFTLRGRAEGDHFGWQLSPSDHVEASGPVDFVFGNPGPQELPSTAERRAGSVRTFAWQPFLESSATELSLEIGGIADLEIDFPSTEAGLQKVLLLSMSVEQPTRLGDVMVPLSRDNLFDISLAGQYPVTLFGARGNLDAEGNGTAFFRLWPGECKGLIGRTVYAAVISVGYDGQPRLSSVARGLLFTN